MAIAALFTDAEGFFKSVNGDPAVLSQFVEKCLDDADCFVGLHDRRICIAGMCRLMAMPEVRKKMMTVVGLSLKTSLRSFPVYGTTPVASCPSS